MPSKRLPSAPVTLAYEMFLSASLRCAATEQLSKCVSVLCLEEAFMHMGNLLMLKVSGDAICGHDIRFAPNCNVILSRKAIKGPCTRHCVSLQDISASPEVLWLLAAGPQPESEPAHPEACPWSLLLTACCCSADLWHFAHLKGNIFPSRQGCFRIGI